MIHRFIKREKSAIPAERLDDLLWCEKMIRTNSSSFYKAFSHLDRPKALAVFAVYSFCRLADDAMDEHKDLSAIHSMRRELSELAAASPPDTPMWRALEWAFKQYSLEMKPFEEMLDGQERDAYFQQPTSFEELMEYCRLVAGSVGWMLFPLLVSSRREQARSVCITLGNAMQLTNILRDIGSDYKMGRIYIPTDLMSRYNVTANDLCEEIPSQNFIALWEALAEKSEQLYGQVRQQIRLFDKEARFPVLLSLLYYSHILHRCRRLGYSVLTRKIYVSNFRKSLLLIKARLMLVFHL